MTRKPRRGQRRAYLYGGLSAAVLTLAAACGSALSAGSGGSATLQMTTNGAIPGLSQVVAAFEKQHPSVKIVTTAIPSNNYQSTLRTELAGGRGPDLIFVWGGTGNPMSTGVIAPMHQLVPLGSPSWTRNLPANVLSLYQSHGQTYAAPVNTYISAFAYNEGAFRAAGIKAPPQTFSQLVADCRLLRAKKIIPMELANGEDYLNMQIPAILADDVAYSADPQFAQHVQDRTTSLATSALWKRALSTGNSEYAELYHDGFINKNSTATSLDEAIAAVASGKAAMTDLIPGFQQLSQDNPHGMFGTFEAPALNTPGKVVLTEAPGAAFAVNAHSAHAAQAKEFINFLAQPEQTNVLAKVSGTFPLLSNDKYMPGAVFTGVLPLIRGAKIAQNPTNYFANPQTKLTWVAQAQDLVSGSATASGMTTAVMGTLK